MVLLRAVVPGIPAPQQVNQAAIVENRRLGPVLAYIAEKQKELDMSRSAKAPRRRGQKNHMFKVG